MPTPLRELHPWETEYEEHTHFLWWPIRLAISVQPTLEKTYWLRKVTIGSALVNFGAHSLFGKFRCPLWFCPKEE